METKKNNSSKYDNWDMSFWVLLQGYRRLISNYLRWQLLHLEFGNRENSWSLYSLPRTQKSDYKASKKPDLRPS